MGLIQAVPVSADMEPMGRSYYIKAVNRGMARLGARKLAAAQGQRNARTARVLFVDRIARHLWEVVLEDGWVEAVRS